MWSEPNDPVVTACTLPTGLIPNRCTFWYPPEADPTVVAELKVLPWRLVAVDCETTGLHPQDGAQVTEIGWYCLNSGTGGVFIPPHTLDNADPFALDVSRYADRIAGQPHDDGTQVQALQALLGGDGVRTYLIGSYPAFDAEHLAALFTRHGLPPHPWNHRMIDVGPGAYWQSPRAEFAAPTGLKEAAAATGVPLDGHHDAWVDTDAAARIWHRLEAHRRTLPPIR